MISLNPDIISLKKLSIPDWGAKMAFPVVFLLLFLLGSGLFAVLAQNVEAQDKNKSGAERVVREKTVYSPAAEILGNNISSLKEVKTSENINLGFSVDFARLGFPGQKVENLVWIDPGEELKLNKKESVKKKKKEIKTSFPSLITAYNSEVAQCDSSPCITASGYNVCKYGIEDTVAANHLRFGTKVKIPEIFGEKVFVVRDRMNSKYYNRLDVWMLSKEKAIQFGAKRAQVQVLP